MCTEQQGDKSLCRVEGSVMEYAGGRDDIAMHGDDGQSENQVNKILVTRIMDIQMRTLFATLTIMWRMTRT